MALLSPWDSRRFLRGATYLQTSDTNYSLSDTHWLPVCHFIQNWLERWSQNCKALIFHQKKNFSHGFSTNFHLWLFDRAWCFFCRSTELYACNTNVVSGNVTRINPGPMLSWSVPWLMLHFSNFWVEFGLGPIKKQTNLSSRHVLLMQISVMSLDLYKPP